MISVILFSKDRPLQTQSFIESLLFHSGINQSSIYILYKANQFISYETLINKYPNITWIRETNFYEDLLNILQKAEDYILWGCDDVFYKSNFDINTCLTALDANENILAFSLRLGENIHPNPGDSLIEKDNYLMWDWTESNFPHPSHPQEVSDWGYPWEVSASIYRKADIYTFFNWIEPPQSPNYLEGDLATIFKNTRATQSRKYLACFPLSKALTLTVNRVQHTHRNVFDATKDTSPNQLYQYFLEGYKLNWSKFENCYNSTIHVGSEYFAIEAASSKNQHHKKTPLVSVICRTYNQDKFIEETIISVLSQTFTDFEFLILDDGSTDKTREILEKYIHDSRIKYVYQENIGKNLDAFHELTNRCIALSAGELIAIIDSDDICLPNRLERQVEEFKTDPDIDIVFSDGYHIDVNGNTLSSDFRFKESLKFNELNLLRVLFKINIIPNPSVMIKRNAIEQMGGFEDKFAPDYHFWLKSAPFLKFKYIDEKLVKYRIHPQSSSTGVGSQQRVFQESVKILWQIRNKFSIFDLYPEIYGCQYRHNALYSAYLHFGNIILTGNFPVPQMAVQEYEKALKNNGQGIEALNNLAVALWLTGEQLNSLQIFQYLKNSTAYQIEIVKHNIDLAEQLHDGNVVDNQNFILLNEQIESSNLLQVIETVNCPPVALSIPSSLANQLESEFDLGEINLIIVPDWEQSEESLYQDLAEIITNILTYQKKSKIKLWVYNNDIEEEDAQILISDVVFHLLMDEELNLSEEPAISLIGNLSDQSLKLFLQQIQGRIILGKENQAVLQKPEFESIVSYHPQQLVDVLPQLINVYPLVSVIIPCYDHADFLSEAIESVVNQTYKNWECIIVNDGSPDNTSEVAKFLIEQYENHQISLIEKTNGGLSDARNAGIKQSSGQYILCLDADDKIGANFLEDSVAILQKNQEIGFVYTDVQYFGAKNDQISYGDFNPNIFLRNNQATATSMFRREVFNRVGGYKTIMKGGLEDWEFWISAYENGWQGYRLAKACFYYRQHPTGSMLQNLVSHKSKLQSLFAKIISLHSQLYTKEEILWSKEIIKENDHQTSTDKSLSKIPASFDGLLNDHLKFLCSSQSDFKEIGEADNYYQYLQNSLDYLHTSIFNNPASELLHQVVNNFIQRTKIIAIYFNEQNLKNIYVKRAEIIEYFLKIQGLETDYEFTDRPVNRKKIRLGILALSFLPSAETYAYLPVYEYLNRDFEVILYSFVESGHPLEQYCQLSANTFRLLPKELPKQAKMIRDDDIDILFIATNITISTNQFCLLAAHRLARIQVTSGASVVTTGMRNMDYYISGTLTDPSPTAQEQYQEKLVKIEGSAHCFSYGTEEGKITTTLERNNLLIPEDAVVFISCANYFKIIPELIETWAKIITQVPNSVLVLLPFGPNWSHNYPKQQFINHLNSIFIKHGLATERLIVLDPQPVPDRQDIKEYYKIADVYLDSFPFAGTTSLIEPLQVNLPVIARQGNCFRSAMGAAMIQTLNIPDLVADSEESYIQLAVALGNNPELRQQKSDDIKAAMNNNPSFLDSRSYSAKMANLFQELFRDYLANNLEENLRLRDINLIIFPDWTQSEDELGAELQEVIQTLVNHPENEKITLIVHTGNIAKEDAEMFLSSVAMNLLMEDLDISDTIDISLVDKLGDMQWQSLLPRLDGKITLNNEYKPTSLVDRLTVYQLDNFQLN